MYECTVRVVLIIIKNSDDAWCCSLVPPAITSIPRDTVVYTGDPYTVQCGATGVPAPVISYYFNGTIITPYVPWVTVNNGTLTIASMSHYETGPYQCFANNIHGSNSTIWVVTVRDPGECNVLK